MKKIDSVALILVLLWLVAATVPLWLGLYAFPNILSSRQLGVIHPLTRYCALAQAIPTYLVQIGVALWLFVSARRGNETPWVWALFGLTYGVLAAILFFVLRVHQQLKIRNSCEQGAGGDAVDRAPQL